MSIKWVNKTEHDGFLKNALAIQGSVTPRVMKKVIIFTIYACCISVLSHHYPMIALPIGPFEYGGLVMGLILVFRVNAGYDRWWEARKLWGNIVNHSRNLAIIILNYTNNKDTIWQLKITHYISALPYLIKSHLRGTNHLEAIKHLLDDGAYEQLSKASNPPNLLSSMIAHELHIARTHHGLDPFAFSRAEEQRGHITDSQGGCERILKTPMPFVMAVKSRRFILSFLGILPFALVNTSLYITPLIAGIVAYALFSLDQIGVELQNPFSEHHLSHLPLYAICKTIEQDTTEMLTARQQY
jgi:ion channel-forming bestrophin family protein